MCSNWGPHKFNSSLLSLSLPPSSLSEVRLSLWSHAGVTGMHHESWRPSLGLLCSHPLCLENSWVQLRHWHEMSRRLGNEWVLSGLEFSFSWVCNDFTMLCKRTPRVLVRQFLKTVNEHYSLLFTLQNKKGPSGPEKL